MSVVRAILKITWASAAGQVHLITSSLDEIEKATERPPTKPPDPEDLQGEIPYPRNLVISKIEYIGLAVTVLSLIMKAVMQNCNSFTSRLYPSH